MNDSRPLVSRFDPLPEDDNPTTQFEVHDRSIGELIREARGLSEQQIEEVLAYQRQHGLRFGEAVVALKLASSDDVLRALSQQYHYDYTPALSLGEKSSELIVATNPFSDEAEAFRDLRS